MSLTTADLDHAKTNLQVIDDVIEQASGTVTTPDGLAIKSLKQAIDDLGEFNYPQGGDVKLDPVHSAVHRIWFYVAMDGDDLNDGLSPLNPKATIHAAIEAATSFSSTRYMVVVNVGPGVYVTDPIDYSTRQLGQGCIIQGAGSNTQTGTEIRCSASFTSSDDLFKFQSAFAVHHVYFRNLRINMIGRGRDAITFAYGGFNTLIENVSFLNVPRWGTKSTYRPVNLKFSNVTYAFCGFGPGTNNLTETAWSDIGGGNYSPTFGSLNPGWYAGQKLRIAADTLPGGFAEHTDYFVIDDAGTLKLSATLGGAPKYGTTAGSDILLYGGGNIPDIEAVVFEDVGGGNYNLQQASLNRAWAVNDVVRFRSSGSLPTGIEGGVDYYIINNAGNLHISDTLGGSPYHASSAGSGTVYMETSYDPDVEGGAYYQDNGTLTTQSQVKFDHVQADMVGRHPIYTKEKTGGAISTATDVEFQTNAIVRSSGSWITDGFQAGTFIKVFNADDEKNNLMKYVTSVTSTNLNVNYTNVPQGIFSQNFVADASDTNAKIQSMGSHSLIEVNSFKSEVTVENLPHIHDSIVGISGGDGHDSTMVIGRNWSIQNQSGGAGAQKALVSWNGPAYPTCIIILDGVVAGGRQYDLSFGARNEKVKAALTQGSFRFNAPIYSHCASPYEAILVGNYGVRSASDVTAYPRFVISADGSLWYGTGNAAPSLRLWINSTGRLCMDASSMATSDPARQNEIWRSGTALQISL